MLPWVYEVKRKMIHISLIIFPLAYAFGVSKELLTALLVSGLAGILTLEILRIDFRMEIPLLSLFRQRERNLSGASFMFLGMILAISAFSKPVAIAVMLMTTLGDAASALVGKSIGKCLVWGPRNLEGILAEFGVDLISGCMVFIFFKQPLYPIFFGALIATITETLSYRVDDNLVVPLFAGIATSLLLV